MNRCLILAAVTATLAAAPCAWGESSSAEYPSKPIRLVVPFAPGGATDTIGRLVSAKMAAALGQKFIVDNRGGGGTVIGTEAVVRAAPDGYSLLLVTPSFTINPGLRKLPYDSLHDLVPISLIGTTPLVMVAHPSLPVKSVKELIALARSRPGEIIFASSGAGSPTHLGMELLRSTGARMTHVPYKGAAPAAADLLGGHVQLMMTSVILVKEHIRRGRLRALGVTTRKRSPVLPEVPAIAETVKDYEVVNWWGFVAPAGMPDDIVQRLQAETRKAVNLPDVREHMRAQAAEPQGSSAAEFGAMLRAEVAKWTKVIREIDLRVD